MKALITGAGSIALRHAVNLRGLVPHAALTVISTSPELREPFSALGANHCKSLAEALDRNSANPFDLAIICSGSQRHAQEIDLLIANVRGLYVEKPIAINSADLAFVTRKLAAGGRVACVVGCNLRYHSAVLKLKQLINEGAAGQVVRASLSVGQWLPDWRKGRDYRDSYSRYRDQGGGVIYDLVHELDSAVHLFGLIENGQAVASRVTTLTHDSDDSATLSLLMVSGLPVQVSMDYVARKPIREYVIVGTHATLKLDFQTRRLDCIEGQLTQAIALDDADWNMASTYTYALSDLLLAMHNKSSVRYSLNDALHTTEWMIKLEANAFRPRPSGSTDPTSPISPTCPTCLDGTGPPYE